MSSPPVPSPRTKPQRVALLLTLLGVVLLAARCDLPTGTPDFGFSTSLRAPLLFDKTFVLLGPSDTGFEALIDTTSSTFDSLLSVDPGDQTIYVVQELDDFDIGAFDDVIPTLDLDPVTVGVSIGELSDQRFEASFEQELGLFILDPSDPSVPDDLFQEVPVIPPAGGETVINVPNFLVPPQVDLVSLSNVTLEAVTFSDNTADANAFEVTIINDLDEPVTAATDPSASPALTLLQNGVVIGSAPFSTAPVRPLSRATLRISVASQTLTGDDLTYHLDVGTASGPTPLLQSPGDVRVQTALDPLEYLESLISNIPAQDDISASEPEIVLTTEDINFEGIITESGTMTLEIINTLPIPLDLETVAVRTLDAIDGFPAGTEVFATSGQRVAASSTLSIPVDIGRTGIAPRVEAVIEATSPGSSSAVTVTAEQGVSVNLIGDVAIEEVTFLPESEMFAVSDVLSVEVEDVRFDSPGDYVELAAGTLEISELVNELDLTLEEMQISIPDILLPPYTAADSLVIRFTGTTDNPAARTFSRIERNSGPRTISVDLAGTRLLPQDGTMRYYIEATSRTPGTARVVTADDEIRAEIRALGLSVTEVRATIEPFSVDVTTDANTDGQLDVLADDEANISSLAELDDISGLDLDGFELVGGEFALNLTTNITADVALYGAFLGVTSEGEQVYLGGRGDFAVAAGDSLVGSFTAGGVPVAAADLLRFTIEAAASPDQAVTRTILLSSENSTVDAFISAFPTEVRFVGKAVVQEDGAERVTLREPFELGAALAVNIPLHVSGDFAYADTVGADLTGLTDLTNPEEDVRLEGAELQLFYANGLPVGLNAEIDVLDAAGNVTVSFPTAGNAALELAPAPVDADGGATAEQTGMLAFTVSESELQQLARGTDLRLRVSFLTNDGQSARLRANDTVTMSLNATMTLNIQVTN